MKLSTSFVQHSLPLSRPSFVAPLTFVSVRLPLFAFFPSVLLSSALSLLGPPSSYVLSVLVGLKLLH